MHYGIISPYLPLQLRKTESPIIGDLIRSPSAGDQSECFDSLQFVVIITRIE